MPVPIGTKQRRKTTKKKTEREFEPLPFSSHSNLSPPPWSAATASGGKKNKKEEYDSSSNPEDYTDGDSDDEVSLCMPWPCP